MEDDARPAQTASARLSPAALPSRLVRPFEEFAGTEALGGLVLLAAAAAALIWANGPFGDSYSHFWNTETFIDLGRIELHLTLKDWVNDGLMAVFFFVVGLEIKREMIRGELADRRRAMLPAAGALGGMLVPAAIYLAFNAGTAGERGWGIPMATDIAFSVGVLALLGTRAPAALKVFLLALAIVDDIGAITVIAIFYTDDLSAGWLLAGAGIIAVIPLLGRWGVRDGVVYFALAVVAWLAIHESGVHATIAGVALGLVTPIEPVFRGRQFERDADELVGEFRRGRAAQSPEGDDDSRAAVRAMEELSRESQSLLDRLEHGLHPWTGFVIVPLFALANAGVELGGGALGAAGESRVAAGVAMGLIVGKPLGIALFSFFAVRVGMAALPAGVRWRDIVGVGMIGGVGFTVSLFISELAFTDPALVDEAKIAILLASAISGIAGYVFLRAVARSTNGHSGP